MRFVVVTAARGAPGVTTGALALAVAWTPGRRVILVECDPAGSSLAPRFGLPFEPGIGTLIPACRHGVSIGYLEDHLQRLPLADAAVETVIGASTFKYGRGWQDFWAEFARAIGSQDEFDVVVDCGRLAVDSPVFELLPDSTSTLLITRPDVEGVAHLNSWLADLHAREQRTGELRVITTGHQPYPPTEVADALAVPVPVESLAFDRRTARWLAGEPVRGSVRLSPLVRSAGNLLDQLPEVRGRQSLDARRRP